MIYECRYFGKRPYGPWEKIDREIYESGYRSLFPRAKAIGDQYTRCVYEYRRRDDDTTSKPCDSTSTEAPGQMNKPTP
jgi:hypothetical protein